MGASPPVVMCLSVPKGARWRDILPDSEPSAKPFPETDPQRRESGIGAGRGHQGHWASWGGGWFDASSDVCRLAPSAAAQGALDLGPTEPASDDPSARLPAQ